MTGELGGDSRCPRCGGRLKSQVATIPFVFEETVVVVKDVPAEVCASCHEPHVTGRVTDKLTSLLEQLRAIPAEVSIISYADTQSIATTAQS